jgi:hypothetical protein
VPALHHLGGEQVLYDALSRCTRLTSLHLRRADIDAGFVNCLAQLPLLQRLHLRGGTVWEQTASAWAELRSLHELQIELWETEDRLLAVLNSAPALRVLRWVCKPPERDPLDYKFYASGPTRESLSGLLTVALRMRLVGRKHRGWPQ